MKALFGITLITALSGSLAYSALIASDNAANTAYTDGWDNGDNGGTGFSAWSRTSSGTAGFFRGSSANNGFPTPSGDINTSGNSWGLFANPGGLASAVRPFTGASLSAGQQFLIKMDSGFI